MVAVLVRHHDAANAVHVDAQLVGAAQQLAAAQAVVDEDASLRPLYHRGVALGPARQNMQVHERRQWGGLLRPGQV